MTDDQPVSNDTTAKWECLARRQGTAGGNDPADCDWPLCGCDPYANKVIDALDENGCLMLPACVERVKARLLAQNGDQHGNPETTARASVWDIAHRHARAAMANIAECQMHTWQKFPCVDGPTALIERAIVEAIEEAGVK